MTPEQVDVSDLERTRLRLIETMNSALTPADKAFLIAFKEGHPDWNHFNVPHVRDLPAIKWKQQNLDRMKREDRETLIQDLKGFFGL